MSEPCARKGSKCRREERPEIARTIASSRQRVCACVCVCRVDRDVYTVHGVCVCVSECVCRVDRDVYTVHGVCVSLSLTMRYGCWAFLLGATPPSGLHSSPSHSGRHRVALCDGGACRIRVRPPRRGRRRFPRLLRAARDDDDDDDDGNQRKEPSRISDEELFASLRRRARELYEDLPTDSSATTAPSSAPLFSWKALQKALHSGDRGTRQALFVLFSVAVMSALSGLLFTFLYFTGAVHGPPPHGMHEAPVYGRDSYVNPYELLERESQRLLDRHVQ